MSSPPVRKKIHTILFGTEHDQVVIGSQPIDPAVWTRIKNLHSETLTLNDTVYRVHIIPELGLGVASWSSTQPLDARLRQQLLLWLPIGLFTSLLTSFFTSTPAAQITLAALWHAGCATVRCHSGLLSADRLAGGWQNRRRRSAGPLAAAGWHFFYRRIFFYPAGRAKPG